MIRTGDGVEHAAPGGGPFNTTRALARLGVPAAFLGHLSDDHHGRELAQLLVDDGASLELATIGHEPTTIARAAVDSLGVAHYQFELDGTAAPQLTTPMLPEHLSPEVKALHLGSLGLVLEPMASTLLEFVEREHAGRLVMLDPNVRPGLIRDGVYRERLERVVAHSTAIKGSEEDFAWLSPGRGYRQAARTLLDAGVKLVVVTLGAGGAFGATDDHEVAAEAFPIEVVDTIGAGDAFGAALLAWLHDHQALDPDLRLDRAALQSAVEYANLAAAVTCSRAGADPPWRGEITRA